MKHERTFIYVRPGKDDLESALQTAKLYQPSVVFFEDLDSVANPEGQESDAVSRMLDVFDGIVAKSTDIIAILTTNHTEKIHKGMLRPGRLDAVIKFGALDAKGIQKLIRVCVDESLLATKIDWPLVCAAMEEFMPAFVKEATDNAIRYALGRMDAGDDVVKLDTEDFVNAANGLREHHALMLGAQEHTGEVTMDDIVSDIVEEVVVDKLELMQQGQAVRGE